MATLNECLFQKSRVVCHQWVLKFQPIPDFFLPDFVEVGGFRKYKNTACRYSCFKITTNQTEEVFLETPKVFLEYIDTNTSVNSKPPDHPPPGRPPGIRTF